MAKHSNRKERRAAKATGKSVTKVTGGAGNSAKIEWDASRPLVRKAIEFAVAHETTGAAAAVVTDFENATTMIVQRQAEVKHARDFLNAIRRRVCEKRGDKWSVADHGASANRVSDYKKTLEMATLTCLPRLIANLKKIETLTVEGLYDIACYMVGTRKTKRQWQSDAVNAPTVEQLEKVIARRKARENKASAAAAAAKGKPKRKGVMGMPTTDAPRSLAYCDSAIAAMLKHWGKRLSKSELKQATAARDNLATLKDAMARIKAEDNAKAE